MSNNSNLHTSKDAKYDEFYTRYEDIQKELNHYEEHFKGKTVLCNADDPFESNFCKFFLRNFNYLGLKRLICTSFNSSPVAGTQISLMEIINGTVTQGHGYVMDISHVPMANGRGVSEADIDKLLRSKKCVKELQGNGDFRSEECIEYLKQADIVVTNPPFSLFREYVALLIEYDKRFLIIGNQNAITYKEIFPLLKDNKMWLGNHSGHTWFGVPKDYKIPENYLTVDRKKMRSNGYMIDDDGVVWRNLGNICWYTNLDLKKRHERMVLFKTYSPEAYPQYDNFDAIDVSKTSDIPMDYDGVMGVPISFLDKFNPEQFEIIGCPDYTGLYGSDDIGIKRIGEEWIAKYRAQGGKGHYTANMTSLVYFDENGKACNTFKRVLIRRKV